MGTTSNLTKTERQAVDEFVNALRAKWPSAECKLFGSKAKGTFDAESDIDILIMLPCRVTKEIRQQIIYQAFEIDLAYGTNINVLIVSEEEWQDSYISLLPIHDFIEEEGVSL